MTKSEAEEKVCAHLRGVVQLPDGDEIVVVPEDTIAKPYGHIVFYNSRKYIETKSFRYALAGNGPVVVEHGGAIVPLGSAYPEEQLIAEYERKRH